MSSVGQRINNPRVGIDVCPGSARALLGRPLQRFVRRLEALATRGEWRPERVPRDLARASLDSTRPAERAPRRFRMGPRLRSAARQGPIRSRCGIVRPPFSVARL